MHRHDPTRKVAVVNLIEPGLFHHAGEFILPRVFTNAFGQVLVGFRIARDQFSQHRQDAERIAVIYLL